MADIEFTGAPPTIEQICALHGITFVQHSTAKKAVCQARELAPCTDPSCAECHRLRRTS